MQGRSNLFQGGVAKVYIYSTQYLGGSEGMLAQEILVKLDVQSLFLMLFRPQIQHVLQFLANRISMLGTHPHHAGSDRSTLRVT